MLCAIRPNTLYGAVDGLADGFSAPDDSPIPPDKSGVPGGASIQTDEIVDTDDEDAFICPPCIPSPWEPSAEEINRHNLTHLPYRSVHIVRPLAGTTSLMRRANQPADHCPFLSLTDVSYETVIAKTHSLCSVDGCTIPELCSPPYANIRALMISTQYKRLCQFLRASGATDTVYKSDPENAVAAVIRKALRLSRTPGDPNHGVLNRAVPEVSAVGQSASNSRAERAVQQLEDLVRTYE